MERYAPHGAFTAYRRARSIPDHFSSVAIRDLIATRRCNGSEAAARGLR